MSPRAPASTIRIGISACLLGENVRFDGQHQRDSFLVDTFGQFVEWVPICPEVEVGLGVPRETMRLVAPPKVRGARADGAGPRLIMPKSGRDLTLDMTAYAEERVLRLARERLSGYVLKKDSPSCGAFRVKVYPAAGGAPDKHGRGLFAASLIARFPHLPVEEEGRLNDPRLRDNFVERVFAYHRLQALFAGRWTVGDLVAFHTAHKLAIMAHSPDAYRKLGPLVAAAKRTPRTELRDRYESAFLGALAVMATPGRHANVLQHMAGYLKDALDDAGRRELAALIDDYRRGLVPLIVPITILRHHVRRADVTYLAGQTYLDPHPKELMLRNHV